MRMAKITIFGKGDGKGNIRLRVGECTTAVTKKVANKNDRFKNDDERNDDA